jgi:glycosyltransferase involved in cell wall biosynthesis
MKILSIVIPSIGRKKELYDTINDLNKQSFPKEKWELIVVIQDMPNLSEFKLQSENWNIDLRVYYSPLPNASLARNIGIIESKGDIILFLDDDLIIENPNFLEYHINNYSNPSIPGVSGQILDADTSPRTNRHKWSYKKHIGWLFFPPNYNQRCFTENGTSANLSVRRKFAIEIGGMDFLFKKGAHREESDFCLRLTKKYGFFLFEPQASVIHLGASQGGCRSWGKNDGIYPFHHILGEWYFILKGLKIGTIKWYHLHYFLGVLFFRQIWNIHNRKSLILLFKAFYISLVVFFKALKLVLKYNDNNKNLLPIDYRYDLILIL